MIFVELDSGKSVEDMEIPAYKTDVKADKYLYLLAGTHGDEVEGVYVLQKLFEWLKDEHSLREIPIVVIPVLNPDGYRNSTRVNSHAVDLNRNYPSDNWVDKAKKEKYNPGPEALSEPENKFFVKLMDKFPPGLVLSFHSWKALLNYNGEIEDVANYLSSHNEYETAPDVGYPTPGSLGCFVPEKYNCGVLTFECPVLNDANSLKSIWLENEEALKSFIQSNLLLEKLK
jgi:protein MpaA